MTSLSLWVNIDMTNHGRVEDSDIEALFTPPPPPATPPRATPLGATPPRATRTTRPEPVRPIDPSHRIPLGAICHVDMSGCSSITATSASILLQNCLTIKTLSLENCPGVNLMDLQIAVCQLQRQKCSQLTLLNIRNISALPFLYSPASLDARTDWSLLRIPIQHAETLNAHLKILSRTRDVLNWSPCRHCQHQLANAEDVCGCGHKRCMLCASSLTCTRKLSIEQKIAELSPLW
jgi:hypothetical protein